MEGCSAVDSSLLRQRLAGKVALVTGGADGIGESTVRKFIKHGAKVCIVDIQDELGQQLLESLGDGGSNALYLHCDVTVEDEVSRTVDLTVEKFGTLDIIVNNAGFAGSPCRDIRSFPVRTLEKVFDVNAKGVFNGMKHAARVMIPNKKGCIISTASVAGALGGVGPHAYVGSKHAVVGLTRNVAAELGAHGIRVNCVSPYAIATRMTVAHLPDGEPTDDAFDSFKAFAAGSANLQGVELTTDDIANAVLFLASDDAKYISGVNLPVDGGFSSINHSLRVFRP